MDDCAGVVGCGGSGVGVVVGAGRALGASLLGCALVAGTAVLGACCVDTLVVDGACLCADGGVACCDPAGYGGPFGYCVVGGDGFDVRRDGGWDCVGCTGAGGAGVVAGVLGCGDM